MGNKINMKLVASLAILTATLIWGSSFVIVKNTVEVVPTNFLLGTRYTIASVLLSIIFFKRLKNLNKEYVWQGAIIGFALFLAYFWQTLGIAETTPGKNAFLTAIYCVLVPFLYWAIDRIRPDRYNIFAMLLCITGIGLVSLNGDLSICRGDLLTLLGGLFFGIHIVLVAKFARKKDPVLITIMQFGFGAIFAWIFSFSTETLDFALTMSTALGILYLAVFCSAIAMLFQIFGQKYTHPSSAAIILSLEAVFGVIFSVIFYHEILTAKMITGFVLIFAAILVSETKLFFLDFKSFKRDKIMKNKEYIENKVSSE